MSNRRRLLAVVAVGLTGGAIYLSAAANDRPEEVAVEDHRKRVRVAVAEETSAHREVRFSGVTRARQRARLSFAVGGRIAAREVEVGDTVGSGQVLARLDGRELSNAVDGAHAALTELDTRRHQAERDRERAARLVESKAATPEELERADAMLATSSAGREAAAVRLREAERLRDETLLRAPFAGTVTEVLREPGEYASPGQTVVTVSGHGDLELEVEVPESVIAAVAPGDAVRVELLGRIVTGRVSAVGRTALGSGHLFPVVVDLGSAGGLVAGMTAELALTLDQGMALAVPVEAVVNPGGRRPAVFRLVETSGSGAPTLVTVERVAVEVVEVLGERVAVNGALIAGDRVVVGGQRGLLDGQQVEVLR